MLKKVRTSPVFYAFIALVLQSISLQALPAPVAELELTESELNWLKNNPSVSFTGDPNWLPYEAFDINGNYIGIVSAHLKLISNMTGIEFKMSPSKTWTESTEKAKQGIVDVLSETDDSDLKSHLVFTQSYLSNPIVIAMRTTEDFVEDLSHIQNRKIALIKDYGYVSKIRRKYSDINFITVDDIHHGLVAISTGEVDALLCTLALCSYTISELGLNDVKIVGKTEFDTRLAFGVQKELTVLLSILNKAIKQISPVDKQLILDPWTHQKFATKTDHKLLFQIIIIFVLLLGFFVFWNRRLSHEIELRNLVEKELMTVEEAQKISLQRLLIHHEKTPLAVMEFNVDFEIIEWNKSAERMFGFTKEDVIGKHATESILSNNLKQDVEPVWESLLQNKGGEHSVNENITKDGRTILCEWYNTTLVDIDGKVIGVASLANDVTERKQTEEVIWKQANFDALTGLPNRNMFHDRLSQEISKSTRVNFPLALFMIDLDEFKEVNDTLGHDVGDMLLKETAKRIQSCLRDSDTVARLGGDEFTVILSDLHEINKVDIIAKNIINKLSQEYVFGDDVIHVSGSIGITLYPFDATNTNALIKNADQAMYEAKKKGRNCFSYFTQSLQDAAQKRLRLTNDLRKALDGNQFELYFQPIVDLNDNHIYKAEALLRWNHPEQGVICPVEFISIAEDTGLINKIGDWVFKESARLAKEWSETFDRDFQITVNISPVQFRVDNKVFTEEWLDYLREFDLSGKNIIVEITEGLLLNVDTDVTDKLLWLRDRGVQVAVDDFGTGYSSLSYLKKFDIDYLKIDKSFIDNLVTDKNDMALSEAIIVMAHKLGLKVIAEGVETEDQKQLLVNSGCDYLQGFLCSRPLPLDQFELLLKN